MQLFILDYNPKKAAQMLADTHVRKMCLETAQILSAILIKNAIGGVAIILLFFALLAPFFEILLLSLFFKFMQAICEPIADNRIIHLLSSFAKIVGMLATLLIMIFVLYFVILILVIVAQNGLVL